MDYLIFLLLPFEYSSHIPVYHNFLCVFLLCGMLDGLSYFSLITFLLLIIYSSLPSSSMCIPVIRYAWWIILFFSYYLSGTHHIFQFVIIFYVYSCYRVCLMDYLIFLLLPFWYSSHIPVAIIFYVFSCYKVCLMDYLIFLLLPLWYSSHIPACHHLLCVFLL